MNVCAPPRYERQRESSVYVCRTIDARYMYGNDG